MSLQYVVTDSASFGEEGAKWLRAQLSGHQRALIALSGGTAPLPVYLALSQMALGSVHMTFTFADERLVPLDHRYSNHRLVMESLFDHWADYRHGYCTIIPVPVDLPGKQACRRYDQILHAEMATHPGRPFVAVLGCGPDGHTASLFPMHNDYHTCGWVQYVWNSPKPPAERITMSEELLLQTDAVLFVARGKDKADIVRKCLMDAKDHEHLPAAHITAAHRNVTWLLDDAAASAL